MTSNLQQDIKTCKSHVHEIPMYSGQLSLIWWPSRLKAPVDLRHLLSFNRRRLKAPQKG